MKIWFIIGLMAAMMMVSSLNIISTVDATLGGTIMLINENVTGDTSLVLGSTTSNGDYGGMTRMQSYDNGTGRAYPIIKINLSLIPDGAIITDAKLVMNVSDSNLDTGEYFNYDVHHVYDSTKYNISDAEWTEGTYSTTYSCTAVGSAITGSEIYWDVRPSTAAQMNTTYESRIISANGGTAQHINVWNVTNMVKEEADAGHKNISILINVSKIGSPSTNDCAFFDSSESTTPSYRPHLDVTYDMPPLPPKIVIIQPNFNTARNNSKTTDSFFYINVSDITMTLDECKVDINGSNYTMNKISDFNFNFNFTSINGTVNYTKVWCNETILGLSNTTDYGRTITFNATAENLNYTQYYLWAYDYNKTAEGIQCNGAYPWYAPSVCMPQEQYPDATLTDTGIMNRSKPTTLQKRNCTTFLGYWYAESIAIEPTVIDTIYYHVWWKSSNPTSVINNNMSWSNSTQMINFPSQNHDMFSISASSNKTTATIDGSTYYLEVRNITTTTKVTYTSTDIYNFSVRYQTNVYNPATISTANESSFIIINLPSDAVLQGLDSDSDGLNDYNELFLNFTDPKDDDTDGDETGDNTDCFPLNSSDSSVCGGEPPETCWTKIGRFYSISNGCLFRSVGGVES